MATKLYVGNLSFDTTEGDLRQLFSAHGTVTSCSLIMDKFTGKSRGFGFIEMPNRDEALNAIAGLNDKDLNGRPMRVNEAQAREDRPPRRERSEWGGDRGGSRGGDRGDRGGRGGGHRGF